jgi:hypothetical protein
MESLVNPCKCLSGIQIHSVAEAFKRWDGFYLECIYVCTCSLTHTGETKSQSMAMCGATFTKYILRLFKLKDFAHRVLCRLYVCIADWLSCNSHILYHLPCIELVCLFSCQNLEFAISWDKRSGWCDIMLHNKL